MAHEIGLFMLARLGGTEIPPEVRLVATTGYASDGDAGAALYRQVPSEPGHPAKFQDSSWRWFELSPNQAIVPEMFGAVGDGARDDQPALQAALDASVVTALTLRSRTYAIGSPLSIPSGKTLQGAGRGASVIKALPAYDLGGAEPNRLLTCLPEAQDVTIRDLTVDGAKVGLGEDSPASLSLVCLSGRGFIVERVSAVNGTGHGFCAGGSALRPCSGSLVDIHAGNCAILFETAFAEGVVWDRFEGAGGDGDIAIEAAIRCAASSAVTYRNGRFRGAAVAGAALEGEGAARIVLDTCDVEVTGPSVALAISGNGHVRLSNSRFKSNGSTGLSAAHATVEAHQSVFEGATAVAASSATISGTGCSAVGVSDPQGTAAARALIAEGAGGKILWNGGSIALSGPAGNMVAHSGDVAVGLDTVISPDPAEPRRVDHDLALGGQLSAAGAISGSSDLTVAGGAKAAYFACDDHDYLALDSSGPWWVVDSTDRLAFRRSANLFQFIIGNVAQLAVAPAGIDVTGALSISGTPVLGPRRSGWGAPAGTASRAGFTSYAAPQIGDPPAPSEVQALADHVERLSQTLKALLDDLTAHGLIGA